MGCKLPPELSKKNLIRDNSRMIDTIKALEIVIDRQLAANIELNLNLSAKCGRDTLQGSEGSDYV